MTDSSLAPHHTATPIMPLRKTEAVSLAYLTIVDILKKICWGDERESLKQFILHLVLIQFLDCLQGKFNKVNKKTRVTLYQTLVNSTSLWNGVCHLGQVSGQSYSRPWNSCIVSSENSATMGYWFFCFYLTFLSTFLFIPYS